VAITINGTKRHLELIYFMHKANVQKVDMDGNYAQQDQHRGACRNTKAQRLSGEGSLSEKWGNEMCEAVYGQPARI